MIKSNTVEDALRALESGRSPQREDLLDALRSRSSGTWSPSRRAAIASRLSQAGYHELALYWLKPLKAVPEDRAALYYQVGNVLRRSGHETWAEAALRNAIMLKPGWYEPAFSLAWMYRRAKRFDRLEPLLAQLLKANPGDQRLMLQCSGFLQDAGMIAEAERLIRSRLPQCQSAQVYYEHGQLLMKLGRFDAATQALMASLEHGGNQGGVYLRLAHVKRYASPPGALLDRMAEALHDPGLSADTQANIHFALGKIFDDLGNYRQAFGHFQQANAIRAGQVRFDRRGWNQVDNLIREVFTQGFFATRKNGGGYEKPVVFVVGMVRSGTTLLEQRLGQHSQLISVGELDAVAETGQAICQPASYPAGLAGINETRIRQAAQLWRVKLPVSLSEDRIVVDKNPFNVFHLGWIALLCPSAKIIHCRRHPLDTALSIYFQNFEHPQTHFAYDPLDIAQVYAQYLRVMRHWHKVLPLPILDVQYEDLVTDPQGQLSAALDFIGLPWEGACLSASSQARSISTASQWQARQPIYRYAMNRRLNYQPWIQSFIDAFRDAGIPISW